jgi:hypothetical protein
MLIYNLGDEKFVHWRSQFRDVVSPPLTWSVNHLHHHVENVTSLTERRGRVAKTPASYSEGPGLKSHPEDFSLFSSVPPDEYRYSTLQLLHDRLLPHPSQFIIRLSPFHCTPYTLDLLLKERRWTKLQINKLIKLHLVLCSAWKDVT